MDCVWVYRLCGARSGSPPKTPFNSNVDLAITHVKMYQRDGDSTMYYDYV